MWNPAALLNRSVARNVALNSSPSCHRLSTFVRTALVRVGPAKIDREPHSTRRICNQWESWKALIRAGHRSVCLPMCACHACIRLHHTCDQGTSMYTPAMRAHRLLKISAVSLGMRRKPNDIASIFLCNTSIALR